MCEDGSARDIEAVPYLRDRRFEQLVVRLVEAAAEFKGLALDDGPVVDPHEVHERGLGVAHQPVHLHVRDGRVDDGALGLELVDGLQLQLEALRFLEAQVSRGFVHGVFQGCFHFAEVALQNVPNGGNAFAVGVLGLLADTRAHAVADVVFEAHPKLFAAMFSSVSARLHVRMGYSFLHRSSTACIALTFEYGPKYSLPSFRTCRVGKMRGKRSFFRTMKGYVLSSLSWML